MNAKQRDEQLKNLRACLQIMLRQRQEIELNISRIEELIKNLTDPQEVSA